MAEGIDVGSLIIGDWL
jgi:hypothetical protein